MASGIFTIPAADYHADPCAVPSLSASIAKILCAESPAHAKVAHPRLTPQQVEDEPKYDLGTAAHALFLEGSESVVIVAAKDWRTKAAQEARFQARVGGRTPLLTHQWEEVQEMVAAAREQIAAHTASPPLFAAGKPEQTLMWEEPGGVICRARLDWLHDDYTAIDDLKCTSRSANPRTWSRTIFGMGYDVQAAFYMRGVHKVTGVLPEFRLAVIETTPPYGLSVIGLAPSALTIGVKKIAHAIDLWRDCLQKNDWPGYDNRIAYAELPAWEEAAWVEQELGEAA